MTVSIMITTRNRAADLRRTLQVLRQLNPAPLEILITADGCTDETVQMLEAETLKPEILEHRNTETRSIEPADWLKAKMGRVRLIVNKTGLGSVASRDRMMREARGDLVLALDDDRDRKSTRLNSSH